MIEDFNPDGVTYKQGDTVIIVKREKGNTTGTTKGYNLPNGNVGDICKINGIGRFSTRPYRLTLKSNPSSYVGFFKIHEIQLYKEEKIILSSFPSQGSCKSLDLRLVDFLRKKYSQYDKFQTTKDIGIAWNSTSYWFYSSFTGKIEYTFE